MTRTNKPVVVTLSIALALAGVALQFAGCGGGPTARAKDLATKAKSQVTAVNQATSDLGKALAVLFAAVSSSVPDKVKFQASEENIKALVEKVSQFLETMSLDYGGIKDLKGVAAYTEWADLQLQALDLTRRSMDSINKFLEQVGQMYASGTPDQAALAQAVDQLKKELADLNGKTVPLLEKATKFAQQNNLF